jgi:hypothetical protein
MTKHTLTHLPPGPYSYRRGTDGCDETFDIYDAQGICLVRVHFWEAVEWAEAVARFFAAAPKILAALEAFLSIDSWEDEAIAPREVVQAARIAIAEATGNGTLRSNMPQQYHDFEILAIREIDDGVGESKRERVAFQEAQYWSLYGYILGEGLQRIGDFETEADAKEVMARLVAGLCPKRPD